MLGKRIQEYLCDANITYGELAREIDTPIATLHYWAQGGAVTLNEKNLKVLKRLGDEIGVGIKSLLFLEEDEEIKIEDLKFLQGFKEIINREVKKTLMYDFYKSQ